MEIKITTEQVLKALHVLAWIIFIGLCVNAGGILFNAVYVYAIQEVAVQNFWQGLNFSSLWQQDHGWFYTIVSQMFIIEVLKALMFYVIIKLFLKNKLNFSKPFTHDLKNSLLLICYICLGISFFANFGKNYATEMTFRGVQMPELHHLNFVGADVWLFLAIILFVVAQLFKRGIEIQEENDLTI